MSAWPTSPSSEKAPETFTEYFYRLDALDKDTPTQFEKLESLINMHFRFVDDFPDETYIIISACPAKLSDSAHICAKYIEDQRQRLSQYISVCLETGIKNGELIPVTVEATTGLLIAMINGLLRRRGLKLDRVDGLKKTAVEFCNSSLTYGSFAED